MLGPHVSGIRGEDPGEISSGSSPRVHGDSPRSGVPDLEQDPPAPQRPPSGAGGPLAPLCEKCSRPGKPRRHRPDLPCWEGSYRKRTCELVFREFGRSCRQCAREGVTTRARTVDHIVPRSRSGGDELRNLQPLCGRHNSSKGGRMVNPYGPADPITGNGKPVSGRFRTR